MDFRELVHESVHFEVDLLGELVDCHQRTRIGAGLRTRDGLVDRRLLESVAALHARHELRGVRDLLHLLLVERGEELLRLVQRHGYARHAHRIVLELRARRRDDGLKLQQVPVRHLRFGEEYDAIVLQHALPRDSRLRDYLEVLKRDLALLARPGGGRSELLEVGEVLYRAPAHGLRLVAEVVVEVEVVDADVEYLLQRFVELRLLLSSFGLKAARYLSKSSLNSPRFAVSRRLMTPSILEKNVSSSKTEKFSKRGFVLLP